MQENFNKAKKLIDASQRILLTMHERMDGDDGGGILALAHHLKKAGKQITCAIKQGVPPYLKFLPGSETIQDDITHADFDLVVMCGCSTKTRCGSQKILALSAPTINIDHHPDNTNFGEVNLFDAGKSSVAELIYDLFKFCRWPIGKETAVCLLTGIITDTGAFLHDNTKAETLKAAAHLMNKGALTSKIIRHTQKHKNPQILRAWGRAMENSYLDPKNKIIYAIIAENDLQELGELPQAAFEGFVSTLNTAAEANLALFVRQDGQVIKASLRSEAHRNVDVSKIAKLFGGGGHKLAAGFSLIGKLVKDETGRWKAV
jgi:phosphoesterase RecJ-like protein